MIGECQRSKALSRAFHDRHGVIAPFPHQLHQSLPPRLYKYACIQSKCRCSQGAPFTHTTTTMSLPPIRRTNSQPNVRHGDEQEPLLGAPGSVQQPIQATLGHNLLSGTAPLAQAGGLILAGAVFYAIGRQPLALFSAHPVRSYLSTT